MKVGRLYYFRYKYRGTYTETDRIRLRIGILYGVTPLKHYLGAAKLIHEASTMNSKREKMNSITKKQDIILKKSIKAKLQHLRLVLPLLVIMVLVACGARNIEYKGTCAQQTQQFMDYIHSLVIDELNPVIDDGLNSGPTADVMKRLEELDTRIGELNTPECNTRTQAVKDALRQYMLETRNYFMIVAGRAVYGEGQVQGQLSNVVEAGFAFEIALEDLQK